MLIAPGHFTTSETGTPARIATAGKLISSAVTALCNSAGGSQKPALLCSQFKWLEMLMVLLQAAVLGSTAYWHKTCLPIGNLLQCPIGILLALFL